MAGAQRLLHAPGNFQASALFEDFVQSEGFKTESLTGSTVSACRKVLCSNSVLDSSEYWLKNDKALCRIGFLEDQQDGGSTIYFVSLNTCTSDRHDNSCLKKLASVSPDLPRLVESLGSRPLKEHEVLLLNGLTPESPDTCSHDSAHSQRPDVCVIQNASGCGPIQSNSLVLQINKFLIGLQSVQERQRLLRLAGQRVTDDDTNRSVSSIEEDFLTASEHLGEESEDDKNDTEGGTSGELVEMLRIEHRMNVVEGEDSEDSDTLCASSRSHKGSRSSSDSTSGRTSVLKNARRSKKESKYASNLAESVLQDAFIHLSQDESSFSTEAAVSISSSAKKSAAGGSRARTHSFELPKIVIVQSPDISDEPAEWPGVQSPGAPENQEESRAWAHSYHGSPIKHKAKPVEIALAYAASLIGTISTPQVTEQLALESGDDDFDEGENDDEECCETEQGDYSLPSAICGMSQVAGAVAMVDLTKDSGEAEDLFAPSMGLLSAAQASAAVTLHCNVAEGSTMDAFRSNVAEILLRQALEVVNHKQSYTSIANFLENTNHKIVDGITHPRGSYQADLEGEDFTQEVAECVFKYALEKSIKRKELRGKEASEVQSFLLERVNSLLFNVLCATSRKIGDISKRVPEPTDIKESEVCVRENEATTQPGGEAAHQHQTLQPTEPSLTETSDENQSGAEKFSSSAGKKEKIPNVTEPSKQPQSRTNPVTVKESGHQIPSGILPKVDQADSRSAVTCFAEELASTVVSMATELAAICLENSNGKQPWFCALKTGSEASEGLLFPSRTSAALRRKEPQNGATKKHRAPRLSEIKRKTEEQPELMERLVNRVVDETVSLDEPATSDPFALFASEVSARIMNCPELNVVDTTQPKTGQQSRSRLQCERWSSRGKASSCESIPEEEADSSGPANTLDPGSRLGHNLSRGSSISKQSSCESITDEFSRFMVNQMETEGRGFDLLLDYYAGKNASNILAAAVQQASRKNGHLSIRPSSCLSKQSSTESITEEFYRFMLKDMDKENKDYGMAKTKEWSNSLLPPPSRTPFCIRQSSVPDRRSSDSRLTVTSPIKANSFDGFGRNAHADLFNYQIYPSNSVSSTGLCKSDSCLYKRGQTDHVTDMLIHETWANSIESLMRKNKIISEPSEDSTELDPESQPHLQLFANRMAADIVESGKSLLGNQSDISLTVGERRRGFKQSRPGSGHTRCQRAQREVPLIHIEPDQRDEGTANTQVQPQSSSERAMPIQKSRVQAVAAVAAAAAAPPADEAGERRSLSSSSEDSGSGWAQVPPEEETPEESSSFIQLSEGNGNSSTSSLGVADLEGFPERSTSVALISEESERKALPSQEQTDEVTSGLSTAGSSCQRDFQVMNVDLQVEVEVEGEIRAALQWIAASELGVPALNYRTTQNTHAKFQSVVHLAVQRSWCVADLFSLLLQFCRLHAQGETLGLFDWLLTTHR